MTSNSPVCYANIPSGTSGRTHTERYSAVQPAGFGKIGMTIEEAADYTGIGRNTLRRLVDWGKIPVLRIGRKSIVRVDVICCFMQINEGRVCDTIAEYLDAIGHIHIADVPGRHEPGTGELNYPNIIKKLEELGYDGRVGAELFPAKDTETAVKAILSIF